MDPISINLPSLLVSTSLCLPNTQTTLDDKTAKCTEITRGRASIYALRLDPKSVIRNFNSRGLIVIFKTRLVNTLRGEGVSYHPCYRKLLVRIKHLELEPFHVRGKQASHLGLCKDLSDAGARAGQEWDIRQRMGAAARYSITRVKPAVRVEDECIFTP